MRKGQPIHRFCRHFEASIALKIARRFGRAAAIPQQTRRRLLGLAAAGALVGVANPAQAVEIGDYFGTWSGVRETPGFAINFRLVILSETSALLDVVNLGGVEIRANQVRLSPDSVLLNFAFGGNWTGAMTAAGVLRLVAENTKEAVDFSRRDRFAPKHFLNRALRRPARPADRRQWGQPSPAMAARRQ
jgi:hypothetical protein